jgi:hypothetical protein
LDEDIVIARSVNSDAVCACKQDNPQIDGLTPSTTGAVERAQRRKRK